MGSPIPTEQLDLQLFVKSKHGYTNDRGCWLKSEKNDWSIYSSIWYKGKAIQAHILSAVAFLNHDRKSSFVVCHRCDVKGCFNPSHLFIGTHASNHKDAVLKGLKKLPSRIKKEIEQCL